MAKRERRLAERKLRNTKFTIFKDLYIQAKHKLSNMFTQLNIHSNQIKSNQCLFCIQTNNYDIHTFVNKNTERAGKEVILHK